MWTPQVVVCAIPAVSRDRIDDLLSDGECIEAVAARHLDRLAGTNCGRQVVMFIGQCVCLGDFDFLSWQEVFKEPFYQPFSFLANHLGRIDALLSDGG